MSKKNYSEWSKEELIREVLVLKKQKTYGLVWEREKTKEEFDLFINWEGEKTKEEFSPESKDKFPVLAEVKDKEISTDKEKPVNLLIEGDNYHSLAVLNFTHKEAIDLIYIDPPYNTGNNDFKYNDRFIDKEDGFRHSKWLSFMSKRLFLAKNLLKEDGIIFISIDDNEQAQLKLLCNDIFGEDNFIANIIWQHSIQPKGYSDKFSVHHNYLLMYQKSSKFELNALERTEEHNVNYSNPDNDPNGLWRTGDVRNALYRPNLIFDVKTPSGKTIKSPPKGWRWSKETMQDKIKSGEIFFNKDETRIIHKIYLNNVSGRAPETIWFGKDVGTTREAAQDLKSIFSGVSNFETPKPVKLLKQIIKLIDNKNATILDFFAGSGTTGHAALEVNKDDGGNRQFILCTNDENKICTEICYPRIKKIISGYVDINKNKTFGFGGNLKYFKTDFVEAAPTDKNKRKLVDKCTEMLCIKETAFDKVKDGKKWKVFKNKDYHLGIIFDDEYIEDFVKEAEKISGKFNVYVFSHDDSVPTKEFKSIKNRVTLCAIPETILKVYRKVFKNDRA